MFLWQYLRWPRNYDVLLSSFIPLRFTWLFDPVVAEPILNTYFSIYFTGYYSARVGRGISARKSQELRGELVEQLAQLKPCTFESIGIVTPVAPVGGNRLDDRVQEGDLAHVLENLSVFVVLNAITDGL